MTEKVKCPNCGAEFAIHMTKCPFCGNTNVPGAEADYLDDLHDMADELHALADEDIATADKIRDDIDDAVYAERDIPHDPLHYGRDVNEPFKDAHDANIRAFRASYDKAGKKVEQTVQKHRRIEHLVIEIVALLLLFVVLVVVYYNQYRLQFRISRYNVGRNKAPYSAEIDRMLEEEDYLSLYHFTRYVEINYSYDLYEEYHAIMRQLGEYHDAIRDLQNIIWHFIDYEATYKGLARDVYYFYVYGSVKFMASYEIDREKTLDAFAGMERDLLALLHTWLGMTQEELQSLPELNETQMQELFLTYYEKQEAKNEKN